MGSCQLLFYSYGFKIPHAWLQDSSVKTLCTETLLAIPSYAKTMKRNRLSAYKVDEPIVSAVCCNMLFCSIAIQTKLNVLTVLWTDLKQFEKLVILLLPLPQVCSRPCGSQPLMYGICTSPAVFPAKLPSFALEQIRSTPTLSSGKIKKERGNLQQRP